jgi:integrase/recombinase XerD
MTLLDYLQKKYAASTVKGYHNRIETYLKDNPEAKKYTYKQIIAYIGVLRQRYSKSTTITLILNAIKAYYNYLCATKQRKDNPAISIILKDSISTDIQLQDLFTTTELETLLNIKEENFFRMITRNKILISLLIYQALKPSEIAHLELSNINLEQANIYIKASTLRNARTLALKANQILLFKDYIENIRPLLLRAHTKQICTIHHNVEDRNSNQNSTRNRRNTCTLHCPTNNTCTYFLLGLRGEALSENTISSLMTKNYQIFKNRKVNCLSIRQSVITNLLKQGHDLAIVQSFAGHKHPDSTQKYQQQKVNELQQALNIYHPFV